MLLYCHFLFSLLVSGLEDIFIEVVDVEYAVEVVDFVLEDNGSEAFDNLSV